MFDGLQADTSQSAAALRKHLSHQATAIQELALQVHVDVALEQYGDKDAHVYAHPPLAMTAEDIKLPELTIGERSNETLLETGLFIVSAVCE